MSYTQRSRKSSLVGPYAFIAAIAFVLLWPLCIGRTLYWGDILLYFEPMQQYAKHELAAGRLPLWNPYISCGQPFVGNPQMNVFYPSTLLLVLFPVWLSLTLTTIVHLFLCGAFMFAFLRRWTVYTMPAVAGAVVYMGGAHVLGRLQFPPMLQTAAYFPLLFAVLDVNIDRPSLRSRLALSVTVALTLLAAHTQVAYLAFLAGTVYALMRLWRRRSPKAEELVRFAHGKGNAVDRGFGRELRNTFGQALPLAYAGAFGLLLVAIYLLPAIQLIHESAREKMSVSQANRFFADFPHLLAVLFPRFTGHPATRDYWARGNAWEPAWFVGWVPLVLAGYAITRCRNEHLVRFWLATGSIGFWLGFGIIGGLYWVAFYTVPGLASFHDPARFLLWTTIAVSALAAIGLDAILLRCRQLGTGPGIVVVASIAAPLAWFAGDWIPTTSPANLDLQPVGLSAIRSASAPDRIAAPANALYWKRVIGDGYMDYGNEDSNGVQRTVNTLISNLDMKNGLESASGYEPVQVGGYVALDNMALLAQQRRDPTTSRLFALQGAGLLLLPRTGIQPVAGYRKVDSIAGHGSLSGWEPTVPISRAWLTRAVLRVEGRKRLGAVLTAPGFDLSRTTLISDGAAVRISEIAALVRTSSTAPVLPVEWQQLGPGNIRLTLDAESEPAFLVYSGTAFPGWKAINDGRPASLYCADGTLIGLPVSAGRHEVILTYAPDMLRIGAYISLASLAVLTALSGYAKIRNFPLALRRTA